MDEILHCYYFIQVEHGCAVATISGSRGVVVVGGATGDDVVEFLDWEIRKTWRTLGLFFVFISAGVYEVLDPFLCIIFTTGKLNRGRGMMPGVGFIGGDLSIVGGYWL